MTLFLARFASAWRRVGGSAKGLGGSIARAGQRTASFAKNSPTLAKLYPLASRVSSYAGAAFVISQIAAEVFGASFSSPESASSFSDLVAALANQTPEGLSTQALATIAISESAFEIGASSAVAITSVLNTPVTARGCIAVAKMVLAERDPSKYASIASNNNLAAEVGYQVYSWTNWAANLVSLGYLGEEEIELADLLIEVEQSAELSCFARLIECLYTLSEYYKLEIVDSSDEEESGDSLTAKELATIVLDRDPVGAIQGIFQALGSKYSLAVGVLQLIGTARYRDERVRLINGIQDDFLRAVVQRANADEVDAPLASANHLVDLVDRIVREGNAIINPFEREKLVIALQAAAGCIKHDSQE